MRATSLFESVSIATARGFRHSIHTIDATSGHGVGAELPQGGVSVYLLVSSKINGDPANPRDHTAAFVDSSSSHAFPRIAEVMQTLRLPWESVKYLFLTHAHLDHAAGASHLLQHCPRAKIVCDPRCRPHILDPSGLISSARRVYGDEGAAAQVGLMAPVAPHLVESIEEGATIDLLDDLTTSSSPVSRGEERDQRPLRFMHVEGHAKHHIAMYDEILGTCFTGDAFGTRFPITQQLLGIPNIFFPTTTPIDFDYVEHVRTIDRVAALGGGLQRFCPTHFGMSTEVAESKRQMLKCLAAMEEIRVDAYKALRADAALGAAAQPTKAFDTAIEVAIAGVKALLEHHILSLVPRCGDAAADAARLASVKAKIPWDYLKMDTDVNALGLVVAAQRALKRDMASKV
jgi:glyoxylase-like metal-dependent hydrolase (beta-lactamase superfamily II)